MIITIILGSLIYLFAFYKQQEVKIANRAKIREVAASGMALVQSNYFHEGDTTLTDFLYTGDSLHLSNRQWGLYDVVTVRARYHMDSLRKAFYIGKELQDSLVLYVADEDRNLSVSGETKIVGNASIPQAGIKPAFVDGNFYKGIKKIVDGKIAYSERTLPAIDENRLKNIFETSFNPNTIQELASTVHQSFYQDSYIIAEQAPLVLDNVQLHGKILITSDSSITIRANADLKDIICIAPYIRVEAGFSGNIQLFAQDSMRIEKDCRFSYPSSLVLFPPYKGANARLSLGKNTDFSGTVLLYEKERRDVPNLLELEENVKITGDLIAYGMLKYKAPLQVIGSTYCYRFVTQTQSTLYENYLIDITLDRRQLNPFYLKSPLWQNQHVKSKNQIVSWLE